MSIYPYQTQEVRDLAWACFSPSIIDIEGLRTVQDDLDNCEFSLNDRRHEWLESLDRDATPLIRHLAKLRSRRLGIYFESLWHYFLSADEEVELVAANLPVQERGRTLGEFDCIYFCRRRERHVHLELAAKFYLGWQAGRDPRSGSEWHDWYGPNARDRLDIKLNHLLEHQIQLGDFPAARPGLDSLGITDMRKEIALKGYLFVHGTESLPPPPGFGPGQALHPWFRLEEIEPMIQASSADAYLILPRMLWLSPARASEKTPVICPDGLEEHLRKAMRGLPRPRLVAALDSKRRETERFFVTGPSWPSA